MKEKFRSAVIIEGPDLMLGGALFSVLINIFFKSFISYLPIFITLAIIGTICFIYAFIYCFVHIINNGEFTSGKKIGKSILLIVFSLFYIPIYYTKYVIKRREWIGIVECVVFILGYIFLLSLVCLLLMDLEKEVKYSSDRVIRVNLPASWICYDENIGDQKLFCLNVVRESSFGVFIYKEGEVIDLLKYHTEQLNNSYLKEGYKIAESKIDGNNSISKLTKDKEVMFTIAGVKKSEDASIVIVYSGVEKDNYLDIYDSIEYNAPDE